MHACILAFAFSVPHFSFLAGRVAKYTGQYITRKTPKEQPFMIGVAVAMLYPLSETLSIRQYRLFMSTSLKMIDLRAGLGSEAKRATWATHIQGQGWQGYWIPFQDQVNPVAAVKKSEEEVNVPKTTAVGSGCDIVLLAVHGGGFIDGKALMFLDYFRKLMKSVQQTQDVKIGILSVEYGKQNQTSLFFSCSCSLALSSHSLFEQVGKSKIAPLLCLLSERRVRCSQPLSIFPIVGILGLAPENPFPGALNEITAAYQDLVKQYGVDSKRIILCKFFV